MAEGQAGNIIRKVSLMAKQTFYRLVVGYSGELPAEAHSLNKALAEELLKLRPRQRSLQMEKCLLNVLEGLPENPIVKDVDVLFNPTYTVDVLLVLISAYKRRPYRLVWSGAYGDERTVFSSIQFTFTADHAPP